MRVQSYTTVPTIGRVEKVTFLEGMNDYRRRRDEQARERQKELAQVIWDRQSEEAKE